jgi:hypothetical protein
LQSGWCFAGPPGAPCAEPELGEHPQHRGHAIHHRASRGGGGGEGEPAQRLGQVAVCGVDLTHPLELAEIPRSSTAPGNMTPGMAGVVNIVDSQRTVHVRWDAGQRFGVIASARHLLKREGDDQ